MQIFPVALLMQTPNMHLSPAVVSQGLLKKQGKIRRLSGSDGRRKNVVLRTVILSFKQFILATF